MTISDVIMPSNLKDIDNNEIVLYISEWTAQFVFGTKQLAFTAVTAPCFVYGEDELVIQVESGATFTLTELFDHFTQI
jgi:hypothetical protein